jgi:putative copper resistance protein D
MPALPPLTWPQFLHTWVVSPGWDVVALVLLLGYVGALMVASTRRSGRPPVHPVRPACWGIGVALLVLANDSAIDVYGHGLFWMHMVQHLLLIMVVPAFLVLGHPLTLLRGAVAHPERVDAVLRWGPVAALTHPLVGIAAYSAVIVGTHLTSFMNAMATNPGLATLEKVLYLGSGYLMLLPLLGYEPIRWRVPTAFRIGLALIAMTPDTIVGIVLMQTNTDPFPRMEAMRPIGSGSALADVHAGGGLMWAGGDGLMMLFAVGLVMVLIANPRRQLDLGGWLEGVRRATVTGGASSSTGAPVDVDDDEEALAAYNAMLARLNDHAE